MDLSEFLLERFEEKYLKQLGTYYTKWLNKKLMDYDWFVNYNTSIKKEELSANRNHNGIFNIFGNASNDYKLHIQSEMIVSEEGARNIALYIDKSNLINIFPEYFKDYLDCVGDDKIIKHINLNRCYYCRLVFQLNMIYYNQINYIKCKHFIL